MSTVKRFEELISWQNARKLDRLVFKATQKENIKRDFKLIDQWRASSGSVMDNIAEGFDRQGNKEFRQFLSISMGSLGEVQSQTYRAMDRNYIDEKEFEEICKAAQEIKNQLNQFINYLKNTDLKGFKFTKD